MVELIALGEIMLRLSPPKYQRLRKTSSLDIFPCGAQFNIAANMANLGKTSAFLTKLPRNELGLLAKSLTESYGVDMSQAQFVDNDKIGMVFVEFSVTPRRHIHIYDRAGSAASTITADDFRWDAILKGARCAYVDGIFPGLSQGCREATTAYVSAAQQAGCTVCFDMNYRETLWEPDEARAMYRDVLPQVDILVTNRSVSESLLGYQGSDEDLLRRYRDDFGCRIVCLTYREMQGILRGRWWSVALHDNQVIYGRPYEYDVVDRFGTGDAFFAGFLHEYLEGADIQVALDFGNALCALAHTIDGDPAVFSAAEVRTLLAESYTLITKR